MVFQLHPYRAGKIKVFLVIFRAQATANRAVTRWRQVKVRPAALPQAEAMLLASRLLLVAFRAAHSADSPPQPADCEFLNLVLPLPSVSACQSLMVKRLAPALQRARHSAQPKLAVPAS